MIYRVCSLQPLYQMLALSFSAFFSFLKPLTPIDAKIQQTILAPKSP